MNLTEFPPPQQAFIEECSKLTPYTPQAIKQCMRDFHYSMDDVYRHLSYAQMFAISLEPIPLTEEWLERFGFTFDTVCYYKDEFLIGAFKDGYAWLRFGTLDRECLELTYVHQLQNLYSALTGTELELNDAVPANV